MGNCKSQYNLLKSYEGQIPLYDIEDIVFPLSTKGPYIVDSTGKRVKLAGANWSGSHQSRQCVGGLDKISLSRIIKTIKNGIDMNVIRLTFSIQMVQDNPIIQDKYISANLQLSGKTALQIFDIVIQRITSTGMMVFLNNHTSKSQWCCSVFDGDGLWYTDQYPQNVYFDTLCQLAERYKHNKRVIGIDIRNQIRPVFKFILPIFPTWGSGFSCTDWKKAAQQVGNRILDIAPHMLIIVGGLFFQLDLKGVKQHPIELKVPNKLIYSGHLYKSSWPFSNMQEMSYEQFEQKFYNQQLFVRDLGVPYLLGEFGEVDRHHKFWLLMLQLLGKTDIDFTYWCIDGYKCHDHKPQHYGIFSNNFTRIRNQGLMNTLKKVGRPKASKRKHNFYGNQDQEQFNI